MARKRPEKLAGKRPMGKDQKNEDEEEDYVEEVFKVEKGSMKSIPIPARNLQKSDETEEEDGKPAGIPPLEKVPRKAVPQQKPAEEKDRELNLSSAIGIDAPIRQTAKKDVLQSAKKEKANQKKESAGNCPKSTIFCSSWKTKKRWCKKKGSGRS